MHIKRTKHFNKLHEKGILCSGVLIGTDFIELRFKFSFEQKSGKTLGIDIGSVDVISCSDGQQTQPDIHGWTCQKIQKKISEKKKCSKAYERCQKHRENFINHAINQLDLTNVSQVKRENIKNLKKNRRISKNLKAWTYPLIFDKLDRYCQERGVRILEVSPTYTSQRCSKCGWVRKSNRKGKEFKCTKCGFTFDADLNAAINISLNLRPITVKERKSQINRKGFYWSETCQERIVPGTQENKR